jgi:xanthine/CO dehydrogenase XdhC/CoxF family maturation factor
VTAFKPPPHRRVRLDTSLELLLDRAEPRPQARVLATVVATAGSTYRKAGARMLFLADGGYVGLLSGGCLETDLRLHAREVIDSGTARAVEYDMRGPDDELFGIGAGCEGAMRVLLEPADSGSAAAAALSAAGLITRGGASTCLVSVHEAAHLALGTYTIDLLPPAVAAMAAAALGAGESRELDIADGSGRLRALVQVLAAAPHVLICGAGPDARPVAAAARGLGWQVTVFDHRAAYADPRHFAGSRVICAPAHTLPDVVDFERCHAAVVMSHHLPSDSAYLRALARAGTPNYVGLLGPAARRQRLAQELGPLAAPLRARLRGPVGLDIGAATPEAIALSIVAEIHAWLADRTCGAAATAEYPLPLGRASG